MDEHVVGKPLSVLNEGIGSFADAIVAARGAATQLEWAPPAGGDRAVGMALARARRIITRSRRRTPRRPSAIWRRSRVLEGVGVAREVLPEMGGPHDPARRAADRLAADMCGPMRGAIVGAILYEGWAEDARRGARAGRSRARSRSSRATTTAQSARWRESSARRCRCGSWRTPPHGNRAFSNLNEGSGQGAALRRQQPRGARSRLRLDGRSRSGRRSQLRCEILGRIELKPLMAQALHMGDEVHNRNVAASALLFKRLRCRRSSKLGVAPPMPPRRSSSSPATTTSSSTSRWRRARRCSTPRTAWPRSSMVTAMARNGVDFGIRVSGTGRALVHRARASPVDGLYFPGYTTTDAAPDLGD